MGEAPLNHPADNELHALSLGQLPEAELARVLAHLGSCNSCCGRLDHLATTDPLLSRLQQRAANREESLVTPAQRRSAVRALRHSQHTRATAPEKGPAVEPQILPAPQKVGSYDILSEVGRGGMGVVYKARHRSLHRLVALKMVLAGEFASPAQEMRFRLEAELAARVRHPNIVQVYEVGSYEGRPFLALEWMDGGSLADRLDGEPLAPGEAAALVETLARAIHVAHGEGVVHRDLKPANILLQRDEGRRMRDEAKDTGSVASHPSSHIPHPSSLILVPKITDFGLAQPTAGGRTMTRSGFLVGTPGYMSPEQAAGKRALVGPATDIYALGVVLYQLLTGQLPFQADSTLELLRAQASDEPTRPRRLQPRLPRDLEAITLHCLEKEPAHRYPSALALAEDLERFREGKQVTARPVGAAARFARACRRRPLVTLLLTLLAVSLFGGLAGVSWKWLEANEQRDQADAEKQEALYEAYRARLAAAGAALQNHDVADAARQLGAAPEALRGWEWQHLHSRLDDSSTIIHLPAGGVSFLLAEPDGLQVGTLTDAGLRLADLEGGARRIVPSGLADWLNVTATPTHRGLRVAGWVGNKTIDLLDQAGQVLCRVEPVANMGKNRLAISPDSTRLASLVPDGAWGRLAVFDAKSAKQTALCEGHRGGLWACTFSPDSRLLASAGEDNLARIWDPQTGALLGTCRGHTSKLLSATFRPDGARLLTTAADGTVRQWEAATGLEAEAPYDRHSGEVLTATYSPDGHWVASAGSDRTVRVWRATGRQDIAVLHAHTGAVAELAFAPGGRRLASLSSDRGLGWAGDNTVRVWDVDPQATLPVLRGHTSYVYPVAFSPDGRWIASGGWDRDGRTVRLWDAATGEPAAILPHPGTVRTLAFSPDSRWLVTGGDGDDRLRIWDVATARVRKEIPGIGPSIRNLALSPDGSQVAVGINDDQSKDEMIVCDLESGERLFSSAGNALAYSPDGRWLAVRAADENTVVLLNARTHETAAQFSGHDRPVAMATFSHDGRRLAICSHDHTVCLWQIDSGACQVLRGHTDMVFAAAFHPDGTRLATAGRDGAIWLWDLARGEEVARLPGHTSYVWSLAFSPDGETLASGSGDFTVRLWDTQPLKVRYQARREAVALRPEAERLIGQLLQQKNDLAAAVEALRSDPALSESLRHAALRDVLRRALPAEAASGNRHGPP
jgi:WD40 repeat protein/serine/threonine protein kinase